MKKAKQSSKRPRAMKVYSNLSTKRRTKKDVRNRRHAEYLATLPKHPVKRFLYRLHPKRVFAYWFSRRGVLMALKITGVMVLLLALLVGGVFAYFRKDLEAIRPGKIAEHVQTTVTTYYDRNGVKLWEDKGEGDYRLAVDFNHISDYMKKATIAIEDKDFYKHDGVSLTGIMRSFFNNAQGGSVQGGSTLTQQLVKQVFLSEDAHKRGFDGIPRKIKEIILATEIERLYTKDQILNLYLNESSYGGRRNGVESAAQTYFKKSAKDLTLAEAALIAGIPNQPSLYNPYNIEGHSALVSRQHKVLDNMVAEKYITQAEADNAKKEPIIDTIQPLADQLTDIKAPHFVLMVRDQLNKELTSAVVGRGGLSIKTSLDIRVQQKLEESTKKLFDSGTPGWGGISNSSSVVEDVQTGQILALLGSRDFNAQGFGQDNAATSFIQPGSSIKPLVYAELFSDHGAGVQNYGSGSVLADDNTMNGIYGAKLANWDGRFMGGITVRKSLALSRNIPAVKAMYVSGIDKTMSLIRDTGDTSYCTQEEAFGLSAAIGGCGVRQVEHTNAFATLARMGTYRPYSTVLEVKNSQGEVLKKFKEDSKQVLDPQAAYIVSDILADSNARASLHGNPYGVNIPGIKTSTKTGTTDKNGHPKDLWIASYSPAVAMTTWLGNSDNSVIASQNSAMAAPVIGDVMSFVHNDIYAAEGKWKSGDWFNQPNGIQRIGGEIYPSYYNKSQGRSSEKIVFDRVSKKKATNCTPDAARIEVEVVAMVDPVTKKKVYNALDGYDPNADDDKHSCNDQKPTVTVKIADNGKRATVSYKSGTFPVSSLDISINGQTRNIGVSGGNGSTTIDTNLGNAKSVEVSASATDQGYYSASSSDSWTKN